MVDFARPMHAPPARRRRWALDVCMLLGLTGFFCAMVAASFATGYVHGVRDEKRIQHLEQRVIDWAAVLEIPPAE